MITFLTRHTPYTKTWVGSYTFQLIWHRDNERQTGIYFLSCAYWGSKGNDLGESQSDRKPSQVSGYSRFAKPILPTVNPEIVTSALFFD